MGCRRGARRADEEVGEVDEAGDLYEADDSTGSPGSRRAFEPSPMLQVVFINVEVFLPNTNPVMVLRELDDPFRELRITIGSPEGVAIAYGWRGIDTPKPLTHELFTEIFELFGLSLEVVRITAVRGAAYSGEIVVNGPQGSRVDPVPGLRRDRARCPPATPGTDHGLARGAGRGR